MSECVHRDDLLCRTMGRKFGMPMYFCRTCHDWTTLPTVHNELKHGGEFEIHNGCPV